MSGAPVFDVDGSVVGIITGGQAGTGIAFAYPEQLLENLAIVAGWRHSLTRAPSAARGGTAIVMDGNVNYDQSGFSFAQNQTVAWNSPDGDILVATADKSASALAQFFLPYDVPPYSAPQDRAAHAGIHWMSTQHFGDVSTCPAADYQYHWVVARQGGTYCVRTRSGGKFIKIKVQGVFRDRISFDWAAID